MMRIIQEWGINDIEKIIATTVFCKRDQVGSSSQMQGLVTKFI